MAVGALLFLAACQQQQAAKTDSGISRLDSLMYAIYDARYVNPERAMVMTDSLEHTGDLTLNMADECRAEIYEAMGQSRTAAYYAKKSLRDGNLHREDPPSYYAALRLLPHISINNLNWREALEYATNGYDVARADTAWFGRIYAPKFLSQIGSCQIMLGRVEEGNESFRVACDSMMAYASESNSFNGFYNLFAAIGNCIECNLMVDHTDIALSWLPRLHEIYERSMTISDSKDEYKDFAKQELEANTALVLAKAGRREDAEKHYQAFMQTAGKTDNDYLGQQVNYLRAMERWDELADLSERVDMARLSKGEFLSLDYLRLELAPMFEAEMKSGRTAKALATANRIITSLDSAYTQLQKNDAAQLAVIYETQAKEAKIAEQQSALERQRLMVVVVAMILAVLSVTILMLQHRRSARRLAAKNRELEQKNELLSVANARAEESSKMKSNFIQQISHEIRTPLNILSGFTQVITSPGIELDSKAKLDINRQITENTDRITGLVNKMLELSEAGSASVIERSDNVLAVQIAAQAVEDSGIAAASHLDFELKIDEGADSITLNTNLRHATRALTLLLDNARKFTHRAEALHGHETTEEKKRATLFVTSCGDGVKFVVEDTGIGVPPDEAERIFDEFVQLDEYYDGTGIGLTVARSIARRLGGDIFLDTSYFDGARFIMTL